MSVTTSRPSGRSASDHGPRPAGATQTSERPADGPPHWVGAAGFYALALASKEHPIVLPALVWLAFEFRRPRYEAPRLRQLRERWPLWALLALVSVGYLVLRASIRGSVTTADVAPFIESLDAGTRFTTAVANWGEYLRLMLYPADLVVDYAPAVIVEASAGEPRFWTGLTVGIAALATMWWAWRSRPLVALGIAWFAVSVFPTSNLVIPVAAWLAERWLYLPSVGLSLAVAGAAALLLAWGRIPRLGLAALLLTLLVPLSVRTWTRNTTWRDSETVARTLLLEHPESYRAQWLVSKGLWRAGRRDEALAALDRAIRANPYAPKMSQQRALWRRAQARARGARPAVERRPLPAR